MNITTWTGFIKRKNSTLQPSDSDGTVVTARLKENTSTANPVFILQGGVSAVNYVRAFARYYFVDDVVSVANNMHELHCSIDVLATYRSTIRSYTAFVERAASNYDTFVNDALLSGRQLIANEQMVRTELPNFFDPDPGVYIVQCYNAEYGICFYSTTDLTILKQALDPEAYGAQDIQKWITSKIAQEFALDVYIGSVRWFPFSFSTMGIDTLYVGLGPLAMKVSETFGTVKYLTSANPLMKIASVEINLPTTNLFGDFRDCSPEFSEYNLMLPAVGIVPLDPLIVGSCIHSNRSIYVTALADIITGSITYMIDTHETDGTFQNIGRYCAGISCDVPIGKSKTDLFQVLDTAVGTGQNAVNSFMQGPGGVPNGMFDLMRGSLSVMKTLMQPQVSMTGGSGNKADLFQNARYYELTVKHYGHKEFPTAVAGRPLYQNVLLSTLSGYVKCGNASVPISGYDQDKEAVNSYLNSGFYME